MNNSTSQLLRILSPQELEVLGERVFCDDEMGLSWTVIDQLPDEVALSRCNARNEAVLRALAMFEEHDETQADDGERAEFHRLDGKLNLALELLAELVRQQEDKAEAREVRFNALGLCWDVPEPLADGTLLSIECYPTLAWPVPLRLFAEIGGSVRHGDTWRQCARLLQLGPGARSWLDKLVFRRHRRTIAQHRTRS